MAFVGLKWEVGACVLTEFDGDEFLRAQPDGLGADSRMASYEVHSPYGFQSRPLDPETDSEGRVLQGRACNVLIAVDGTQRYILLGSDPRPIEKLPRLDKGESMFYGPAANFARCKADGTVTLFTTTDGTYDGQSVYAEVAPDGFRAVTPWGKLELSANGFHVLTASGARIDAGALNGLPAPLSALGSYVSLAAAIVKLEASALALGSASGSAEPAAKATSLQVVLETMQAALTAIGSALSALGNTSAGAAILASEAAVTAGATSIPATSSTVT